MAGVVTLVQLAFLAISLLLPPLAWFMRKVRGYDESHAVVNVSALCNLYTDLCLCVYSLSCRLLDKARQRSSWMQVLHECIWLRYTCVHTIGFILVILYGLLISVNG